MEVDQDVILIRRVKARVELEQQSPGSKKVGKKEDANIFSWARVMGVRMDIFPTYSFTAPLRRFPGKGAMHYLEVPPEAAEGFGGKSGVRLVCGLNGCTEFHCGLMYQREGTFYVYVGGKAKKAAALNLGESVRVALRRDESPYGMPMPEELAELLAQDPEGDACFHRLTPGRQRTFIYYVSSSHSVDTRVKRAIEVADKAKVLVAGKK